MIHDILDIFYYQYRTTYRTVPVPWYRTIVKLIDILLTPVTGTVPYGSSYLFLKKHKIP